MTNTTPWQVMMNANNASKAVLTENNLSAVKSKAAYAKASTEMGKMVVMPKRYSFDDNGGGYRGL